MPVMKRAHSQRAASGLDPLSTLSAPSPGWPGEEASRDCDVVRRAISYLSPRVDQQPELAELAAHLGLSPAHVQRIFKRWCGLSPKEFVQALTLDHARRMLSGTASVLAAAHEVGLSGGSRLHDLFITHQSMTPGDERRRGAGLALSYGFVATPFGEALAARSGRGLVGLSFVDEDRPDGRSAALDEMRARWPLAEWREDAAAVGCDVARVFAGAGDGEPVRIVLIGTDFEVRVWQLLTRVPMGTAVSYGNIATALGDPKAARAVGAAVGRNPLAFVVPCHRVLRSDGGLGGYHWNVTRKQALIGWEAGKIALG